MDRIMRLKSSELREGMLLCHYGVHMLLPEMKSFEPWGLDAEDLYGPAYYGRAVIIDTNEAHRAEGQMPPSWCFEDGDPKDGKPRWTVQANDLVTNWPVLVMGPDLPSSPECECGNMYYMCHPEA